MKILLIEDSPSQAQAILAGMEFSSGRSKRPGNCWRRLRAGLQN